MTRRTSHLDTTVGASRKDGGTMQHNDSGRAGHDGRRPRRRLLAAGTVAAVAAAALGAAAAPASATGVHAGLRQVSAPRALAAAAPAAGALSSTACTPGTGTATCTLYASTGTLALPGLTTAVPVWNFTAAPIPTTSTPSLPGTGPLLVVNQGDQVTISLRNDLAIAAGAVSLAIPGMTGLSDDATGAAAAGGSTTYTFTASRPGTYLYEAGHTDNGPRQVLMGLVGALVVRPTGFDATAATHADLDLTRTTAAANPTFPNTFEDEAVMVLSEVDPAFNAAPLTYDLRNVRGRYRLINGRAFPQTAGVATAPGHRVLIRYVNAGSGSHSMGVQNLGQRVVAIDAQPGDGGSLVADTLPGGQTEDVMVTEPASGGTFAVYDASGALDTAGQKVGTTQQVAFGGMMTLLGTDVTPATGVGPVSKITSVTPNPAVSTGTVTVGASFGTGTTAAELLIDGEVTTVAVGTSTIAFSGSTAVIPTSRLAALSNGQHRIYVRAASGSAWGAVTSAVLNVVKVGATTTGLAVTPGTTNGGSALTITATGDATAISSTITAAQMTVDGGAPVPMNLGTTGAAITTETVGILAPAAAGLAEGTHTVTVESQDALTGTWGIAATTTFGIDRHAPTVTASTSPSVTPDPADGTVGSPADPTSLRVSASFTDQLAAGLQSPVTAAEGFFPPLTASAQLAPTATDFGKGFVFLAADGAFGSTTEAAYGLVPLTQLTAYPDGQYRMWVHGKDAAGNWGDLVPVSFTVKRGLFSDGFESGNTTLWSGGTAGAAGAVTVVGTTPAATPIAGQYSMLTNGAAPANVADLTPAAETGYHARFAIKPALSTSNAPIGIFTGLSGALPGAPVFQVQLRRGGTASAVPQVRMTIWRAIGTATTAWVNLPAGSSSIQVDWTCSTTASVTLTVNGAVSTLTGQNTSPLRIDTVRLGLLQPPGASTVVSGTALFDSFRSSRTPLT